MGKKRKNWERKPVHPKETIGRGPPQSVDAFRCLSKKAKDYSQGRGGMGKGREVQKKSDILERSFETIRGVLGRGRKDPGAEKE